MQWGDSGREVDFFDLKGICQQILNNTQVGSDFNVKLSQDYISTALHPGQSADIYYADRVVGSFGMLHPRLQRLYKLKKTFGFI